MSEMVVTAIVLLIAGCYGLALAGCALVEMCAALAASKEEGK
jgi:hypothetical protein